MIKRLGNRNRLPKKRRVDIFGIYSALLTYLCLLVTSKAPSSIFPYVGLSPEAWIWLAIHEKGVSDGLGISVRLSRCKASVAEKKRIKTNLLLV